MNCNRQQSLNFNLISSSCNFPHLSLSFSFITFARGSFLDSCYIVRRWMLQWLQHSPSSRHCSTFQLKKLVWATDLIVCFLSSSSSISRRNSNNSKNHFKRLDFRFQSLEFRWMFVARSLSRHCCITFAGWRYFFNQATSVNVCFVSASLSSVHFLATII